MKNRYPFYFIALMLCIVGTYDLPAQKYKSVSSEIHFYSEAPVEDIEAENRDGQSVMDIETGEIVFSIPIVSFLFEKSLMQEHFNENYLESEKYPKATFSGKVSGFDREQRAWQDAEAKGKMTIHGVENEFSCKGKIKVEGEVLKIEAKFPVELKEYKIKIPKVVFYNIAEIVDVTVNFEYEKMD